MEEFKHFKEIMQPDERNLHFVSVNRKPFKSRKFTLDQIYASVAEVNLIDAVPEGVRSQFNVAKNLAVYSWFSYQKIAKDFQYI